MRRAAAVLVTAAAVVALANCGEDGPVMLGGDDDASVDAQSDVTQPPVDGSGGDSAPGEAGMDAASLDAANDAADAGCVNPVLDCPATESECRTAICTSGGACGLMNAALGAACTSDAGGVVCNGAGACVATHCMDGVEDGDETGRDCGGATCNPCGVGGGCLVARDCTTDYCAGGTTCALAPNGNACTAGTTCASGDCVESSAGHVCCATACSDMGAASCGETGACSASGAACELYGSGTRCAAASCSSATEAVAASTCDGAGTCVAGAGTSCSPYICNGGACLTACGNSDARCAPGAYCDGVGAGACHPKLVTGSACTGSGDSCVTGDCVDGYCCNARCNATCMACSAALTGGANGTCGDVTPGTADGACVSCNGMGACNPNCGDGIIETGEECDLGANNGVQGSGCSATCQLTGDFIPETEPNNSQATANPLGTHAGFIAAINPASDVDYFSFSVPGPTSSVTIQTSDGVGGCPAGFDSVLRLYGPNGTQIATNDNGGVPPCSLISPATQPQVGSLAAGTYIARVDFNGDNGTTAQYVVTIAVQ